MSDSAAATSERESERIGLVVGERYTLIRRLGRGGMGSVWQARDEATEGDVALKLIDKRHGGADVIARFEREARAISEIDSRHVVKVVDHGLDPGLGPYIALELLEGEDLGKRLDRESTLPVRDVVQIIVQACRGLWEAHQAGIIHRDVKPENLFLEELRGKMFVKIVDFGVAKLDSTDGRALTAPGELLGTLEYMSPEHVMAKGRLDARADLYSLAVVAYRSLTGRPPFVSDQIGELILQLMTQRPAPPSTLRRELPAQLDAWFTRALDREPADRFQTAHEMAEALVAAFRASTAKVENFDAPLSLSPASVAKLGSRSSAPPPIELADVPELDVPPRPAESRRPPAAVRVASPSISPPETSAVRESRRPATPSARPSPERPRGASRPPSAAEAAPQKTERPLAAPLPEVRPPVPWDGGEAKMLALVAAVMVAASLFFYVLAR